MEDIESNEQACERMQKENFDSLMRFHRDKAAYEAEMRMVSIRIQIEMAKAFNDALLMSLQDKVTIAM